MKGESVAIKVVVGVAGGLVLLLVIATVISLEEVERVVKLPPGPEARRNPLLAAERLLERMGLPASSVMSLQDLPPTDHVVILAAENRVPSRARAAQVLDWVADGGYLIVGPYLEGGRPTAETHAEPLLEALGVGVVEYGKDEDREPREALSMNGFAEEGRTFEVRFYSEFGLFDTDEPAGEDEDGFGSYAVIWQEYGSGLVVVINDLRFLRSDEIGDLDHAAFLWDIVDFGEPAGALLVHGSGKTSLGGLLLRHAWPVLLAAGLWLGAWVWRRAVRLGPLHPEVPHGSRALMDHVDGLAHFLWRAGRVDALVTGARRALERRITARRPEFLSLSREQQVEALDAASDLGRATIDAAVFGACPRRRDEYTRTIRTLEHLRREL